MRFETLKAGFCSLKLTLTCLISLIALVALCTLGQVKIGTFAAVDVYMRSFFVYAHVPGWDLRVPVFPGGALVGLALLTNLAAVMAWRLRRTWAKLGLWLVHGGLVLLIAGEFVTGMFAVESQMAIQEGETKGYIERPAEFELAVIDSTDPAFDEVSNVSEKALTRGEPIQVKGLPFALLIKRWYPNSLLDRREAADAGAASIANRGVGPSLSVRPSAPVPEEVGRNEPSAFVELVDGDRTLGTWLVSSSLGAPQEVTYLGRRFALALRPRREYLPFTLELKDFTHERYPGTDIPKNFSSLVRLENPQTSEARDVLIYMNSPLRYAGKTFYQASFGDADKLSILQVVRNPGWLLPYVSCTLMALGLLVQFGLSLKTFVPEASA